MAFLVVGAFAAPKAETMKDPRDGKKYRTVQIGSQTWMAENLNFEMEGSCCYENNSANCKKFGRLYTWDAALKACPAGWHLPARREFKTLFEAVGSKTEEEIFWTDVAKNLKSKSGWKRNGNGVDAFGFSAIPAGGRGEGGVFFEKGAGANFWSSMEDGNLDAYLMCLMSDERYGGADMNNSNKDNAFSVRCVKD